MVVCYNNESKAHSQHKCINYERYLDLNLFFGNSFKDIKNFVINTENVIKDIQKLYNDLDDQKNNLLKFSLDIYDKIDKSFNEQQVKLNDIISNLSQKISKLNNFRKNIKKYVTHSIPIGYSEFGNMDELKKIIKERIEKINIELINDNKKDNEKEGKIREYFFTDKNKPNRVVIIREDLGHKYPDDPSHNRGHHFNVEVHENGKTIKDKKHYDFD